MKNLFLIAALFLTVSLACSDLTIEFQGNLPKEELEFFDFNNIDYFGVSDLNKIFKAIINVDIFEQRIIINLYQEQIIVLMNSSFMEFKGSQYNFIYPTIQKKSRFYLPKIFMTEILSEILPDHISYDRKNNKIAAETPFDNSIRKIVIDPGHGGKDPGAIGYRKNHEKKLVLQVANKLCSLLEREGLQVILTRSKDEFVSLKNRTELANSQQADLFISLHCNSSSSSKAHGIEVYFLSPAKTDEARVVEAMENSVVYNYEGGQEAIQNYDDLSYILMDMAQSEHLEESQELALKLQANLVDITGWYDRGIKQAGFFVLKGAFMPAVLVEMGFISNKNEESKLLNSDHQSKIAKAIFNGIIDFKKKFDLMR